MTDNPSKTDAEHAQAIAKAELALKRAILMAAQDGLRIEVETIDSQSISAEYPTPEIMVRASRMIKA